MTANIKPISVTLVTTQIFPFTPIDNRRGLAETSGLLTSALVKLGVDMRVVVPYFLQAAAAIDAAGMVEQIKEDGSLRVRMGGREFRPKVKIIDAPFEPTYPIYFIDHSEFYGRERMFYGSPEDFPRFAFLHRAALALHHRMGASPDIFDVQEHQGGFMPLFLRRFRSGIRNDYGDFFKNTMTALGIHDFSYRGGISLPPLYESEMCYPDLLQAGLEEADRVYTRSYSYLQQTINGGDKGLATLLERQVEKGRVVGLCSNDERWDPSREFPPELAEEAARHKLMVYLSLLNRPVEQRMLDFARQTSPPLSLSEGVWGSRQKLGEINPKAVGFYDELSEKDRAIIDQQILLGRRRCFARITNKKDLENILEFLRIEILCDFEEKMEEEGLGEFKALFYPGDLNRLFSNMVDLDKSENKRLKKWMGKASRVSLFSAMEKLEITNHIVRFLRALRLIASVQKMDVASLIALLNGRGDSSHESNGGIGTEISEFAMLSGIYNRLVMDQSVFRCFVLAVLLHDIGKIINHEQHPAKSLQLIKDIKWIKVLLDEKEFEFLKNLIMNHSAISDSAVTKEAHPSNFERLYKIYSRAEERYKFFDALFLFGIADMDAAHDDKGLLSPKKLAELGKAHKALVTALDIGSLKKNLAQLGLSPELWGNVQWAQMTIRDSDSEQEQARSKKIALNELVQFCRRMRPQISRKEFKVRLGKIEYIWRLADIIRQIDDPKLRARLLIRIVALANITHKSRIVVGIEKVDKKLLDLLAIGIFSMVENHRAFKIEEDDESGAIRIMLPEGEDNV